MSASRLYELIDQIGVLLRAEQRQSGLASGLQPVHYQLLAYLNRCNRFSNTPAAATRYLGLTKGTVSQSLLLLEKRGLIEKVADTNDRRVVHLLLTDEGLNELLSGQHSKLWQEACRDFRANELEQVAAVLEGLLRSLQRANDSRTFGVCKTCRHLESGEGKFHCGLTGEVLLPEETEKICHEHEFPAFALQNYDHV